jgi:hypothetical protein
LKNLYVKSAEALIPSFHNRSTLVEQGKAMVFIALFPYRGL